MTRRPVQRLPVSTLAGGDAPWHTAWVARRIAGLGTVSLSIANDEPIDVSIGPSVAPPPVTWAGIRDERSAFVMWIDRPGWIADDLSPGVATRWLDAVLLDRVVPLFAWLERAIGIRLDSPMVRFGIVDRPTAATCVRLRVERGGRAADLCLDLPGTAALAALLDAFAGQAVASGSSEATSTPGGGRRFDVGAAEAPPAIEAWVVEAHAPIPARTLSATLSGDGLVLDPAGLRGLCRLWVAHAGRWYELGSVTPAEDGAWAVSDITYDGSDVDATIPEVESPPAETGAIHVAAAITSVGLNLREVAWLCPGSPIAFEPRPDRLRRLVSPDGDVGLAEMLAAGRHRLARMWSRES